MRTASAPWEGVYATLRGTSDRARKESGFRPAPTGHEPVESAKKKEKNLEKRKRTRNSY